MGIEEGNDPSSLLCVWGDPKESNDKSTHEMKGKVYMNTFQ
jgi:hypothetical protein